MPVRLCDRCGGTPRACRCRKRRAERRPYSGTAQERAMREAVIATYGDRCVYEAAGRCDFPGEPVGLESRDRRDLRALELAHVIAHADGGPFTLENLRPSHRSCNRAAGRRPITGGPDGR